MNNEKVEEKMTAVPTAAHLYVTHFEALRALVREVAAAGAAAVAAQELLGRACESGQVESTLAYSMMASVPRDRRFVPGEKLARLRRTLLLEAECLEHADTSQTKLARLGLIFVKRLCAMRRDLGQSFTLKLARHCHEVVLASVVEADVAGWRLFCTWWMQREPAFVKLVVGTEWLPNVIAEQLTSMMKAALVWGDLLDKKG